MNKPAPFIRALSAILLLTGSAYAAAPVASPAVPLSEALKQLTADDYQTRQGALDKIQAALAQNIHDMLLLTDPETRGRITTAFEYNIAMSHWALDVLALPADQRTAMANWGTTPEVAPLIAKCYAKDASQRAKGIHDLAANSNPNVNILLARLIRDEDPTVQQAAISAAKTRPANPAVIDALWDLATEIESPEQGGAIKGMPNMRMIMKHAMKQAVGQVQLQAQAVIVGQAQVGVGAGGPVIVQGNVNGVPFGNMGGQNEDAPSMAVTALIGFKDPSVAAKVRTFFQNGNASFASGAGGLGMFGGGGDDATQNVLTLAEAYQVKEVIPHLMKVVSDPAGNTQSMTINGHTLCTSNRTEAMAAVCLISGQKPEDYKLQKSAELNAWVTPDVTTESTAADKLTKWFQSQAAATAPAITPAKD